MKKKVITSAILTIALAFSLLLGATYAMFTSESKTNIAISSGKVDVQAVVLEESIKTYSLDVEQEGGFELGGSVLFEENTLSIEGIMPGDKVEFTIQVKNLSNVAVLYRTILKAAEDNGLFHGLVVTVDGSVYDGSTSISNWIALNNTEVVKEVQVSVELPVGRGNEYQDKSTLIQYTVEAVQGNAVVEDPQTDTFYIYTASDLVKFAQQVNSGNTYSNKKIELSNDIDLNNVEWLPIGTASSKFEGHFDGKNHTISNFQINSGNYVGFFGYIANATIENLVLSNVRIDAGERVGALVGNINGNATISNITTDNNSFIKGNDSNTGGIIGEVIGNLTVNLNNLTNNAHVENTKASNSRAAGIVGQITSGAKAIILNAVNNGSVTTNQGFSGGIVSAIQGSASVTFINNQNNGLLINGTKGAGVLAAWVVDSNSHTIETTNQNYGELFGLISGIHRFNINNVDYYFNDNFNNYSFESLINANNSIAGEYLDFIAGFYNHANETNSGFGTADRWNVFTKPFISSNKTTLYTSSNDWASYYRAYAEKVGMTYGSEEFINAFNVTWEHGKLYKITD